MGHESEKKAAALRDTITQMEEEITQIEASMQNHCSDGEDTAASELENKHKTLKEKLDLCYRELEEIEDELDSLTE